MHILTITTLYPNAVQPRHGVFVKNRLSAIDGFDGFSRKVIAPVPNCPLIGFISDRYKQYQDIPLEENVDGIDVFHPRYFTLPGVPFFDNASSMAQAVDTIANKIYSSNKSFDLVDGQYLYPDGVAAYKFAKKHNKPLILTARGSDVNFWMENKKARAQILEAIGYAHKVICVSNALKQKLIDHGVNEEKLEVIINGIDPDCFNTGIEGNPLRGEYFLSVGNFVPLKGHDITLEAFAEFRDKYLIIIGDGELRRDLKKQANDLGISGRVQFIKHVNQHELARYYAGAKATILMSSMEGMPNVILESLACGTPVIATNVGGIPEIANKTNSILLDERNSSELSDAIKNADNLPINRAEIAESVKQYRWAEVAKRQHNTYEDAINTSH